MFKKLSIKRIILILWIIFSILYVINGEYTRLKTFAYDYGRQQAVSQVIATAQQCQPFPVSARGQQVTLVSLECLQQQANQPAEGGGGGEE